VVYALHICFRSHGSKETEKHMTLFWGICVARWFTHQHILHSLHCRTARHWKICRDCFEVQCFWQHLHDISYILVCGFKHLLCSIYGMSSFPLTNSYFLRWLSHHQPVSCYFCYACAISIQFVFYVEISLSMIERPMPIARTGGDQSSHQPLKLSFASTKVSIMHENPSILGDQI